MQNTTNMHAPQLVSQLPNTLHLLQTADCGMQYQIWTCHCLAFLLQHRHGERALPLGILFGYSAQASQSQDLKPRISQMLWKTWGEEMDRSLWINKSTPKNRQQVRRSFPWAKVHEVEELDVKQRENTPRWPQLSAEAGKPAAYRTIDKQARARETIFYCYATRTRRMWCNEIKAHFWRCEGIELAKFSSRIHDQPFAMAFRTFYRQLIWPESFAAKMLRASMKVLEGVEFWFIKIIVASNSTIVS